MSDRTKAMIALVLGLALPAGYSLFAAMRAGDMKQAAADYCGSKRAAHANVIPANARSACALWGFR
jgi:hypothetical protein